MPKLSWRSFFKGCYGKIDESPSPQPRTGKTKTNSPGRLSLCDISNTTPPLSPKDLSLSLMGSNLHIFTMLELRAVTRNFSTSNFIGEGGFGPVYKGLIDDKLRPGLPAQTVAVKRLDLEGLQGHKEWLAEVIFLGQLQHSNLVKLIGYCYEDEHRLLVYEFIARGSLENHLFKRLFASLPWCTRLKIAVGAAKGLAFLHEAENPVIYRDFKASNILLDSDYNAKLSDLGLAKDGPEGDETHVSTRVMGTPGYAAPDYIMSGHLTTKSDVYSFGVVLLELLTGRHAIDKTRPNREQDLVEWARPYLRNAEKLSRIIDPNLDDQYSAKAAEMVATLAYRCLNQYPKSRPQMRTVVEILEPLQDLADIPVGPFVYMVTAENGKDDDKEEMTSSDGKEDGHLPKKMMNTKAKENGLQHCNHTNKLWSLQSALHSDTTHYRDSQRHHRGRRRVR